MKTHLKPMALLGAAVAIGLFAGQAGAAGDPLYEWQIERLLHPTEKQVAWERKGNVFIYWGLKESDIDLAWRTQPDRIEAMMFVNTIRTDANGEPRVDPETGELQVDDDC